MILFFGGIYGHSGVPPYEFRRISSTIAADKVFVRDHSQRWYHDGVSDTARDIWELKEYLQREIDRRAPDRVVAVGNSMGGYAAILFGELLRVDQTIAFAPQTFLQRWRRYLCLDFRWERHLHALYSSPNAAIHCFSLRQFLVQSSSENGKTRHTIYYCPHHRRDRNHALHLARIDRVQLFPVEDGGHAVVQTLRDSGRLMQILAEAAEG